MAGRLSVFVPNPRDPAWEDQALRLRGLARAHLLPVHFIQAILRDIGGDALEWRQGNATIAAGYRLPAQDAHGASCHLAYFGAATTARRTTAELRAACERLWPGADLRFFDGEAHGPWPDPPVIETRDGIAYAPPRPQDAAGIQQLQAQIWQFAPADLYPTALHHPAFHAVRSWVARRQEQVVGFLFGFLHGGPLPPWPRGWPRPRDGAGRMESQVLGIHPAYRRRNIAYHLKRLQARTMQQQGVEHIQWVTDPLQFRNANLNFGRLGAVSCQLLPDHLPFRNALNRVPASRLRLLWPLKAAPVQNALATGRYGSVLDLAAQTDVAYAHDALRRVRLDLTAPRLAVEIPAQWTRLQQQDAPRAQEWRRITDRILAHYLGPDAGQYMITGTGARQERTYLVAERMDDALAARYR